MSRRNSRPWVKLWADCLDSRQLARAGEPAELLFYRLLALNGTDGAGDTLNLSASDLAWRMRMAETEVSERLERLESAGLIVRTDAGIRFAGWDERQSGKTDSERARQYRERSKSDHLQRHDTERSHRDAPTVLCRDAPTALELESESEEEEEHTHNPLPNTGGANTVPPVAARVAVAGPCTTDEPLRAMLDAWNATTGQRLVWSAKYFQPTEQAHRLGATAGNLPKAIRVYMGALKDAPPSFKPFCGEFDKWASYTPQASRKRDDPRLGSPSPASSTIWRTPESVLAARAARGGSTDEF